MLRTGEVPPALCRHFARPAEFALVFCGRLTWFCRVGQAVRDTKREPWSWNLLQDGKVGERIRDTNDGERQRQRALAREGHASRTRSRAARSAPGPLAF